MDSFWGKSLIASSDRKSYERSLRLTFTDPSRQKSHNMLCDTAEQTHQRTATLSQPDIFSPRTTRCHSNWLVQHDVKPSLEAPHARLESASRFATTKVNCIES